MNMQQWHKRWESQRPRILAIKPGVPLFSRSALKEMREAMREPEPVAPAASGVQDASTHVPVFDPKLVYEDAVPTQSLWCLRNDGRVAVKYKFDGCEWGPSLFSPSELRHLVTNNDLVPTPHPHPDYPQQDDEWLPWVEHKPGPCPIPWAKNTEFQYRCKDGVVVGRTSLDARHYPWSRDDLGDESIVAYRLRRSAAPYSMDNLPPPGTRGRYVRGRLKGEEIKVEDERYGHCINLPGLRLRCSFNTQQFDPTSDYYIEWERA